MDRHFCLALMVLTFLLTGNPALYGQQTRWQQRVSYTMDIDFDVQTHRYLGTQRLVYSNNSPDTLRRVFYHLYFNAFQPNSAMDVRSRTIADPDSRVGERIAGLSETEIGFLKVRSLRHNGRPVHYLAEGTILEVTLDDPIAPNGSAVLEMEFEGQVPIQIRRSGRDNREGIAYSMSQWYPKLCEYDEQGWHANPYIAREFYGVWGDFEVNISIDRNYVIGATGYLQNPDEIGHGYSEKTVRPARGANKLTWRFLAPNVHDFVWAADPGYTHTTLVRKDSLVLHFFYEKNGRNDEAWARLPAVIDRAFDFINRTYGPYPYRQYSFIQGGDGGMEYPMATLITGGERDLLGLVGVALHELMHSWFQMLMGSNESLYAWMDEGFTSYAASEVRNFLRGEGLIPGRVSDNPHRGTVGEYARFVQSGMEEPMSIHADHFQTNAAYQFAAYRKGEVFLTQLQYIIGEEAFNQGMLDYYYAWRYRHPNANDFIRVMEKRSGLELDWYKEYMVYTTRTVDYALAGVDSTAGGKTSIRLDRLGLMPMPLDLLVTYADGTTELFNIPLDIMRGSKPSEERYKESRHTALRDWQWVDPHYSFTIDAPPSAILRVQLDPSGRLADTRADNNRYGKD